jgi:D-tyrosyl-tRNA(Tyr) deacylase
MIGLLQRVSSAHVEVNGQIAGAIDRGVLALVCAERDDDSESVDRLLTKLLAYRIFPDGEGRMNRSLVDVSGGLLLVPQFTLAADTRKGTRPSFSNAAPPELARALFNELLVQAARLHSPVANGLFGEHMQIHLVNDGPVTFWLHTGQDARA